jgi:CheY-like chemotaxis protein
MPLIALIDDRPTNRAIFTQLARGVAEDIEILTFASAREALECLRLRMPDLVITDYNMPEMNGAAFVQRFRLIPHYADIPVIVITVHDERSWRIAALDAGASDFLNSPVDHLEFVTRARNLLTMRQHQILLEHRIVQLQNQVASLRLAKAHAMQDTHRQIKQVVNGLPVLVHARNIKGEILFCNEAYALFSGHDDNKTYGDKTEISEYSLSRKDQTMLHSGICPPPVWQTLCDKFGREHRVLVTKSVLKDRQGRAQAVLTSAMLQASKRGAVENRISTLPDKSSVLNELYRQSCKNRCSDNVALHLVHWSGFSAFNDISEETYMETVLIQHLRSMLRGSDILASWDEATIAIVQKQVIRPLDAHICAQRIRDVIAHCVGLICEPSLPDIAIGVALSSSQKTLQALVTAAQHALEKAKLTLSICFSDQDKNPVPLHSQALACTEPAEPTWAKS